MIKSFSQYLKEDAAKEVFFTFGRFNPPSSACEKLFDKLASLAEGKTYRIYSSSNRDQKNNPLTHEAKVKWMRKMFPKHARAIVENQIEEATQICSELYAQGFTKVTLVTADSQRVFADAMLNRYNGQPLSEGFYNFQNGVKIIGVELHEQKLCEAAAANDLESFSKSMPVSFEDTRELFNAVRIGMGLQETKTFRKHIQLESVSERREQYVTGELFKVGNSVVIKESEEVGTISFCGSNYLIVELQGGKKVRKWLNAVEPLSTELQEEVIEQPAPKAGFALPAVTPRVPSKTGKPLSKLRTL